MKGPGSWTGSPPAGNDAGGMFLSPTAGMFIYAKAGWKTNET